jgi:hypothetical protein
MKVKCINNTDVVLPKNLYVFKENSEFSITIGKEYIV